MKKFVRNFQFILLCALCILSLLNVLVRRLGYLFQPVSYHLFLGLYTIFVVAATVFSIQKRGEQTRLSRISGLFLPLVSAVYVITLGMVLELSSSILSYYDLYYEALFALSMVSSLVLFFYSAKRVSTKVFMGVIAGILTAIFGNIVFLSLMFGSNFVEIKVIRASTSPDETYAAWLVSSDQGALGGDTFLYARELNQDFFVGAGTFKTREHVLRAGNWGEEYELNWEDDDTLVTEYGTYQLSVLLDTDG